MFAQQEFTGYLAEAMQIQKALQLRLVVHEFSQWNARAANHLVSGSPLNKLLLVTFRLRKLAIPDRLRDDLDDIEDDVQALLAEAAPQDDEGFKEYLEKCRERTQAVSAVLDSIIAGKDVFNIQQDEIDSCLSQMKLLRQTNTTMEETPKAAIATIEALQDILVSMNQINILVRGVQAFFKIKLRQKEDAKRLPLFALFSLLLAFLSVMILMAGAVLLILGLLSNDTSMTSIGIAMLASTILIYLVLYLVALVKKKAAKAAILPLTSNLSVSVPVNATASAVHVAGKDIIKNIKKNAILPTGCEGSSAQEDLPGTSEITCCKAEDPDDSRRNADAENPALQAGSSTLAESKPERKEVQEEEAPGVDVDEKVLREEIVRYAVHLGMDPDEDTDLFWIAEQAYHAHLPSNWAQYSDDKGNLYYYNKVTGISSWSHPLENQFRSLYMQMKASKEKFGSLPAVQEQAQGGTPLYNPQKFATTDSAVTSDNESEYESEGSRYETSRDSFSSSFMGSYFSSLVSPRGEVSELASSQSDKPQNRSYTSGVTGKHLAGVEGSSVNLEHIPHSKFSESSPAFMKKDLPISARPPPKAFLASLSDSSAGHSMRKALNNIVRNM